ncbi:hypothetical protein [Armatimonas sp.]|uniref:hypothetical protein n=1 Tax=Armatimonas sp. TaxID=1872638 RepID=UPI00374D15D3
MDDIDFQLDRPRVLFSDFFQIAPEALEAYGTFNISLVGDLPLFIDPFLLFNSEKPEYQVLHEGIIQYLKFLRDKSLDHEVTEGELKAWYFFKEIEQNWFGFSKTGNKGSALGREFAEALNNGFRLIFSEYGQEQVTKSSHLEKLCLIAEGVGRDRISDFTTNLIKDYLLSYTERFAREHLRPGHRRLFRVPRARFRYETGTWAEGTYELPAIGPGRDDFVILTPQDILTQDDTWINNTDLINDFAHIPPSIGDEALRAQVDAYFREALGKETKRKEERAAARRTVQRFPQLIDYYIRYKEENGDKARAVSDAHVELARNIFLENFPEILTLLTRETDFFNLTGTTYEESLRRARFLKQVIEHNEGYRFFYDSSGYPIKREADLQVLFRFCWYGSPLDVNREVNNGRGPVDYKVSLGASDATLVEFKLASNTQLRRNLEKQVEVYKQANQTKWAVKVILFFDALEEERLQAILKDLGMENDENVISVDARRDNKPSGSKAS